MQIRKLLGQSEGQMDICIFILFIDDNELEMLPKIEASNLTVSGCDFDGPKRVLFTASYEHEADV